MLRSEKRLTTQPHGLLGSHRLASKMRKSTLIKLILVFSAVKTLITKERIAHRQRRYDRNNIRQAPMLLPAHQHPREPRRQREQRHRPPQLSNLPLSQRTKMIEDFLRLVQRRPVRRRGEGKVRDGVDVHAFHLEDDSLDWRAEDLWLRECFEVMLEER